MGGGSGGGEMGERGQRCQLPLVKYLSPGDVMSSTVTTVNSTVLHIGKLLRD